MNQSNHMRDDRYRYVSLPVEIEAFQMTPERRRDNTDWPEWLNRAWNGIRGAKGTLQVCVTALDGCDLEIVTLEGNHRVSWGDYIIRGTIGELYPCKPEVFERKYREVVEPKP